LYLGSQGWSVREDRAVGLPVIELLQQINFATSKWLPLHSTVFLMHACDLLQG
jgi:hypothetical protein